MRRSIGLGLALALGASAALAVDWTTFRPQGYVSDFAGVVDVASKGQLEAYCAKLESSTNVQLALVTIRSLQGEPIEDVARSLAQAWGVGHKGTNDGVLLLLSIVDRRSRLEIGSGLADVLGDSTDGEILAQMRPALRQEHYGEALMAAAETLGATITKARNVTLDTPMPRSMRRSFFNSIPWPVILGGIALIFWLMRSGRSRGYGGIPRSDRLGRGGWSGGAWGGGGWGGGGVLPALILGDMLSRSTWGSRGSGGFDGYDAGDIGGFGGGDFGGGGASSDW